MFNLSLFESCQKIALRFGAAGHSCWRVIWSFDKPFVSISKCTSQTVSIHWRRVLPRYINPPTDIGLENHNIVFLKQTLNVSKQLISLQRSQLQVFCLSVFFFFLVDVSFFK